MKKKFLFFLAQISFILCTNEKIQDINNICHKIENKYSSLYSTAKEFLTSNINDYEKEKNARKTGELYNLLVGRRLDEDYAINYFSALKDYSINIYIITIGLLWIIFGYFFYCKKCILRPEFKFYLISSYFIGIIIIIFILIIIFSANIISNTKKLVLSMNDASCNILNFFYELNHGKIKEHTNNNSYSISKADYIDDNWPGLFTLNSILLDTLEQISEITNKNNETFSFLNEINGTVNEYKDNLNSLIERSIQGIQSPNFQENQEIKPIYLYEFKNTSFNNTLIWGIFSEFEKYLLNPKESISHIYNYSNFITKRSGNYELQLNDLFDFSS